MAVHRITRRALYERVWEQPLRAVAPDFGISDVGLAKLCRRENIPIPGVGYWSKRLHGKAPARPVLPDSPETEVQITGTNSQERQTPAVRIVAVKELHPLATQTDKLLATARPSWKRIVSPLPGCLNVAVSKDGRRRALLIMSSLIATLDAVGARVSAETRTWRWSSGGPPRVVTAVAMAGDEVEIELTEPSAGKMRLGIGGWLPIGRKSWNDSALRPLEKQVGAFAAAVLDAIPVAKAERLRLEAEQTQRRAAAEAAKAAERAREWEVKRRRFAQREIRRLRDADALRRYAESFSAGPQSADATRWTDWVRAFADQIDPRNQSASRLADLFDTTPTGHAGSS